MRTLAWIQKDHCQKTIALLQTSCTEVEGSLGIVCLMSKESLPFQTNKMKTEDSLAQLSRSKVHVDDSTLRKFLREPESRSASAKAVERGLVYRSVQIRATGEKAKNRRIYKREPPGQTLALYHSQRSSQVRPPCKVLSDGWATHGSIHSNVLLPCCPPICTELS